MIGKKMIGKIKDKIDNIRNKNRGYNQLKNINSPSRGASRGPSSKSKVSPPISSEVDADLEFPSPDPSKMNDPQNIDTNSVPLVHVDALPGASIKSTDPVRSVRSNGSVGSVRSVRSVGSVRSDYPSHNSIDYLSDDPPNNFIKYAPNLVLNSFIEQINNIYKEIKNFFNEIDIYDFIYIFLITIIIIVLILLFIWHSIYYKAMKNNSCMENKNLKDLKVFGQGTSIHDKNNIKDLYSIHYTKDLKSNSYKEPYIKCECPKGNIVNKFTAIPYYYNKQNKVKDKVCECDDKYEENLIYRGNSGLKRYMNNQENTNIFKI